MHERPTRSTSESEKWTEGKTIEVTVYLRPSGSLDWVDEEAGRAPAERQDDVARGARERHRRQR